jgi:hypothetical protein
MRFVIGLLLVVLPSVTRAQAAPPVRVAPNAPADRPVVVTDTGALGRLFALLEPCVAKARATYPAARDRYIAGLPSGHYFFVTTRLRDAAGRVEQAFIAVDSIRADRIHGVIANQIRTVAGYQGGQAHVVVESDLIDWTVARPDGSEEGNAVGKFVDALQRGGEPPRELCAPDA